MAKRTRVVSGRAERKPSAAPAPGSGGQFCFGHFRGTRAGGDIGPWRCVCGKAGFHALVFHLVFGGEPEFQVAPDRVPCDPPKLLGSGGDFLMTGSIAGGFHKAWLSRFSHIWNSSKREIPNERFANVRGVGGPWIRNRQDAPSATRSPLARVWSPG